MPRPSFITVSVSSSTQCAPVLVILQIVEYGSNSSLYEQLLQMRETGVYISVHTSNLANAPLLQPGSAVFEIIQVGCASPHVAACLPLDGCRLHRGCEAG